MNAVFTVTRLIVKSARQAVPLALTALILAPLAALHAAEPISLSADHASAVNRQRRIFFQYDPAADIQRKGGFGANMNAVMSHVFDAASHPPHRPAARATLRAAIY